MIGMLARIHAGSLALQGSNGVAADLPTPIACRDEVLMVCWELSCPVPPQLSPAPVSEWKSS